MLLFRSVLVSLFVVLCGCGSGDPSESGLGSATQVAPSVRETTTRFLEAIQAGDEAVFQALLTENARAALSKEEGFSFDGKDIESFEVGTEILSGQNAEVPITIQRDGGEQQADLLLRDENGLWRVHGMSVAFGDGKFTLDFEAVSEVTDVLEDFGEEVGRQITEHFEEAFSDMQAIYEQGGTLEEIRAKRSTYEALAAVTPAEFEASWKVDLHGGGQSGSDLVEGLLAPTGLAMFAGEHAEALAVPISLELKGVSRMQAIEAIAAAAGLYPLWPDRSEVGFGAEEGQREKLTFASGTRPYPTAVAGPFLIEIAELKEEAPRPIGEIEFVVHALGLDAGALAFQTEMGEVLRVTQIRSATDVPLSEEQIQHWSTPVVQGSYFTFSIDKELSGLLRNVEEIGLVQGEVRFSLPAAIEEFELAGSAAEHELDAGLVKVTGWEKDVSFEIVGTDKSLDGVSARMSPRKASGDPLGTLFGSANGWGSKLQANLQCPEPPAAVDVKLCRQELLTFPFELRHIPLRQFQEQPEKLESLSFPGQNPIQVELIGTIQREGDKAEVKLKLTNACNKDVTSLLVQFFYLDANGTELSHFPHTLNGEYDFDTQAAGALVAAHESIETTSFAAFLPAEADSVRFEIERAEFPDGTEWETGK